jgi:hypothetical protein
MIDMSRTPLLLIIAFLTSVVPTALVFGAEPKSAAPLLRDGFVFDGVDGNLVRPYSNDVWFFELTSDVNDYGAAVKAGTQLELLPSSTLEKMIADKKTRTTAAYRLWNSRVTRYKGKNFIFPGYFRPLSTAEKSQPSQRREASSEELRGQPQSRKGHLTAEPNQVRPGQARENRLELDEPNDVLSMPREFIEKLKADREKTPLSRQPTADSNEISIDKPKPTMAESLPDIRSYSRSADAVYVDRTGFLIEQHDGRFMFVPDALGRNVQKLFFNLLPCAMLELTELKQAAEPEKIRFKIAGIITKYKGEDYLLLEKATRAYSYGNFGR